MRPDFVPRRQVPAVFLPATEPCVRGHLAPRYAKFGGCVECVREHNKIRREKTKVECASTLKTWIAENREYSNARRRQYRINNPARHMVNVARKTAKKLGLPFDLTPADVFIPECCPILGVRLECGTRYRKNTSPSLDRIVPSKGYVKGNVIVISWRANRIKSDASIEELRAITDFYARLVD